MAERNPVDLCLTPVSLNLVGFYIEKRNEFHQWFTWENEDNNITSLKANSK